MPRFLRIRFNWIERWWPRTAAYKRQSAIFSMRYEKGSLRNYSILILYVNVQGGAHFIGPRRNSFISRNSEDCWHRDCHAEPTLHTTEQSSAFWNTDATLHDNCWLLSQWDILCCRSETASKRTIKDDTCQYGQKDGARATDLVILLRNVL